MIGAARALSTMGTFLRAFTHGHAPVIAEASLRRRNVRSGDHAAHHLTRALTTVRASIRDRQVVARADSTFCTYENVTAAVRHQAWSPFTIPQ